MEKHSGFNGPCKIPAVPGYIYIYICTWMGKADCWGSNGIVVNYSVLRNIPGFLWPCLHFPLTADGLGPFTESGLFEK